MAVYKRGNRWWLDFMLRGVRYRRSVPEATTKKQAMAAETRFKNELLQGKYDLVDEAKMDITFAQYSKKYLEWSRENKRSHYDVTWMMNVLVGNFGPKRLSDISPIDIERYKVERRRGVTQKGRPRSPASVNRELALLRHVLSFALRDGLIRKHPMKDGKVRLYHEDNKVERYLTEEEETRLLAACVGPNEHLRPIIIVALYTGMRRGEIFNLKWSDIQFNQNLIHIRQSKSGKSRSVHLPPNVRVEVKKMLPLASESQFVFANPHTGNPFTDIKKGFATVCTKAAVVGLRFHDLRHTFATRLARQSGNLVDVAHALGHSQIRTTMRYAHAIPEHVAEAIDQLAKQKAQVIPMPMAKAEGVI